MSLMTTIRDRALTFFARPEQGGRLSLSEQRAKDKWGYSYLGFIGKRIANDDPLLASQAGGNLALWSDIHDDDKCYSCFQQRRLAVVSRTWEVEPGATDRRSKKAAELLSEEIKRIGWDHVCSLMLFGVWYGYAVGEAVWRIRPDGLIGLDRIDVPDRSWFGFDMEGKLRITDAAGVSDQPVPERKFWHFSSGGDHDFVPYGIGLAHWLFWPVFFKRQGMPFWLRFLEKWGTPTTVGKVSSGKLDDPAEKAKVIAALRSLSSDAAIAVPDWLEVDLLDAARSGESGFEKLITKCEAMITQVILSQSMTSEAGPAGLGSNQASVHKDVRDEVVKSDADLLHESFNRTIAVWLTEFNFPGATPPRVYRVMDDPEDLNAVAERDTTLKGLGWHRTPESFAEVYGEGFEYREPVVPKALGGPTDPTLDDPQNTFTAEDKDAIDRLVTGMAKDGNAAIRAMIEPLRSKLAGVSNPEVARIALLDFVETMDSNEFAEVLAPVMLAARAAGEAGIDVDRVK